METLDKITIMEIIAITIDKVKEMEDIQIVVDINQIKEELIQEANNKI